MIGYSKESQTRKVKQKKNQSEINTDANEALDKIYKNKKMYYQCELRIAKDCLPKQIRSFGQDLKMTYAHRHKRDWYKQGNRMWMLKTFNQTLRCCIPCHQLIESNKSLTEGLFKKHRSNK